MNPFKKLFKKHQCDHQWKEMPWYLEVDEDYVYAGACTDILYERCLVAPFVCVKCGLVSEKVLERGHTESVFEHNEAIRKIEDYAGKKLQPKFIVAAMIENAKRGIYEE